jgi:erythronate-4-phosphate dehydrogenase
VLNIVADQNIPLVAELFKTMGNVTLVDGRGLTSAQVKEADVLLVRSVTRIDEQLLCGTQVQFVGSATAGYDHLDVPYLEQRQLPYALAPGANAQSVVEYVLAAICSEPSRFEALINGAKLGVVGYGHVGKRLVEVANCLGIDVSVYDPLVDCGAYASDLDHVLRSDVISLHCELTNSGPFPSKHLLNADRLGRLGKSQLLINAARGGVIDNEALLVRLHQPNAPTVILDCWEYEPLIDERLVPMVSLATPHIAGYSYDAKVRGTMMLRDALAQHLGCGVSDFKMDSELCLDLDSFDSFPLAVANLLSQVYRIEIDDAAFRSALARARSDTNGEWFDQLRRAYPIRRELWGAKLYAQDLTDITQKLAQCFRLQFIRRSL